MSEGTRKSKVTEEHLREAKALLAIWNRVSRERRDTNAPLPSQGAFGVAYGIGNQSAVWQFLHGRTPLSAKAARAFATGLGCKISDFSPRLAQYGEAIEPAEPSLSEDPGASELGLRLANAYAALPAALPDGRSKAALYTQLMAQIRDAAFPTQAKPAAQAPRPEPTSSPAADRGKRRAAGLVARG